MNPYRRLALALLILGLGCRAALYFLNHPLYRDEAYLAINFLDRDFAGLTGELAEYQVAPVLFLFAERVAFLALGPAEWALRLVPFLAGVAALGLFWHLARLVLNPPAAALAVGLLAVSRWPLHMTCQVKPYSLDLLAAVGLLTLAIHTLRQPRQMRWLAMLIFVLPIALASSFPAVFVAGAVAVVLLPVVWQRPGWSAKLLVVAYGVVLAAGFLLFDVVIARRQGGSEGDRLQSYMAYFWSGAFPPHEPVALVKWLVYVHFGPLTAYPAGGGMAAGALAFPAMLLGAWVCWRNGQRQLVVLLLLPFALTLIASAMGKYPYGGCTRLVQHLAPAVCLLSGVGVAHLCKLVANSAEWRCRMVYLNGGCLAAFSLAMVVYFTVRPYRDDTDLWAKQVATAVVEQTPPRERVFYTKLPEALRVELQWYLRINSARPMPLDQRTCTETLQAGASVWVLTPGAVAAPARTVAEIVPHGEGMPACKVDRRARCEFPMSPNIGYEIRADLWEVRPTD